MQRLLGSILIIASTSGAGFLYGRELQNYLEKLLYIRQVVYMLKGEMEYSHAPLMEVFGRLKSRVREPYKEWFEAMKQQIEQRKAVSFEEIWAGSADRYLAKLRLRETHLIQLKELGTCLGQLDGRSGSKNLELYLERLDVEIEKVRGEIAAKKRIGNCLGVMGGIFLVVILI